MPVLALLSFLLISTPNDSFVYISGAEPEMLDPHRISSLDAHLHVAQMFEGLTSRDITYSEARPGLAQSWTVSDDGKIYKFNLRKNIRWSNGEPLTAEQILQSFLRAMNPAIGNEYITWYKNLIVGAADYNANIKSEEARKNIGIKVIDASTIQINLLIANPHFLEMLSLAPFSVVHPSMMGTGDVWNTPSKFICNGAYKLTEWKVNDRIIMEKNENYFDAASVQVKKIVAYPVNDAQTTLNMYQQGQIDWTGDNHIPTNLVQALKKNPQFLHSVTLGTYMVVFNTKRKPFDDKRVRKALALAVDRKVITDVVLKDGKRPAHSYVPEGMIGYESPISPEAPLAERIVEAKKLLAAAGYADVKKFPRVVYLYNTNDGHHRIAQSVQQMWKQNLGIDVGLENQEWKVFLKTQDTHNFDLSRLGWIAEVADPAEFMEIFTTESLNNKAQWSNIEFDALIRKSFAEKDVKKRVEYAAQAEKLLIDESPMVPLYQYVYYSLLNKDVKGMVPNVFGTYLFKFITKESGQSENRPNFWSHVRSFFE